ncbi:hypothetical protein Tco_1501989 [Tanacetum coccineum]
MVWAILVSRDMKGGAIELCDEEGNEFVVNKQHVKPYQKDILGFDADDDVTLDDRGGVTQRVIFDKKKPESSLDFHVDDSWMTILSGSFVSSSLLSKKTRGVLAFNEFNCLLKIDIDLFTYDIQDLKIYDKYEQELNNDEAKGTDEPWSEKGAPYQICDHICEPYRFKNGKTKWPTCTSDIDGFCNGGELPGMLEYEVLVILQECWWKVNAHKIGPFTRMENFGRGPYANMKTEWVSNPYLDTNRISGRDYEASNVSCTQENQKDDPIPEPSNCKVGRFEMMKYSFNDDEEYITIKESEYLNQRTVNGVSSIYHDIFRKKDEGWTVHRTK